MVRHTTLGTLITPAPVVRCGNHELPILSMTMYNGIVLQSERFKKSLASTDQSNYKVVEYGQLVVGFPIDEGVLYIQKATEVGIMSPAYSIWNVDSTIILPDYLELCLHSPQAMQYYKDNLRGTTARRRSIPTDDLLGLRIAVPSMEQQRLLVILLQKMNQIISIRKQQLSMLDELVKSRCVGRIAGPEMGVAA